MPKLTDLIFEDDSSCTSIGTYAFYNSTNLTSLTIPSSITTINTYAFYGPIGLTEIEFNAIAMNDAAATNNIFYNSGRGGDGIDVTIGANVTKLPASLFYPTTTKSSTPKLNSVTFEEGSVCSSIGSNVFRGCTTLTSFEIPSTITSIGTNPFTACPNIILTIAEGNTAYYVEGNCLIDSNLKELIAGFVTSVIPSDIKSIKTFAFYEIIGLTSITIPMDVASIGTFAFQGCSDVTEINFNATELKDFNILLSAFNGCGSNGDGITMNVGSNVTKIPAYMFGSFGNNKAKIKNVIFAEESHLVSIGASAFSGCTTIESIINIPSSVTTIGSSAFKNVTGYLLCENTTVAELVVSATGTNIYVLDSDFDATYIDFTVLEIGLINGTYTDELTGAITLRVGEEDNYTYYQKF